MSLKNNSTFHAGKKESPTWKYKHTVVEGLALSYSRERPGSPKRIELLSCVAQQFTNKELKEIFKYIQTVEEKRYCALTMR